jgi:TonB-linked SusC/RagA family outer membrane protein
MKSKLMWMLMPLLVLAMSFSYSQEKTVTGNVTDEGGLPLPGVSIVVVGTSNGTQTDFDGNYTISASVGQVLSYSYIGQTTVTRTIGADSNINVQMTQDAQALEEVVVTALGIERQKRTLGYGTDIVKGDDLIEARESNIVNALQGKVTGVQITSSGGNLGGSSAIIIRGASSLSGRNRPLWVVDGILINDSQTVTGSRIAGNRDFFNGSAVVNPDDVESINILKGAAATALYGSRASAGAIIVTTKRGKKGRGAEVTLNTSVRFDDIFRTPDYQQEYAMGSNGIYDSGANGFDWGPRIVGQTVQNLPITGQAGPLTAVRDNGINNFFKTGITQISNFAVADADEKTDYRASLTYLNQSGILPGANLERITAGMNVGLRHSDALESRFSVQYTKTKSEGTAAVGANDPNIVGLGSFSSTLDPALFDPWIDESGNQINFIVPNQGANGNNFLWLRNENAVNRDDDRIFGSYQLTYRPVQAFSIMGRVGIDFEDDKRLLENSKGTFTRLLGDFTADEIRRQVLTADLIATYQQDLSSDFNLNLRGGLQYNARIFESQSINGVNLLIPELFSPGNAEQVIAGRDFAESRLFGVYGAAQFGYKDWATLELTARNDFSSTLPIENNSYFYPSASLAFVFTDALNIDSNVLNFGKFRASWAEVGNDTGAYQLDFNFFPRTTAGGQYGLNLNFPFNGALAYSASTQVPPADLRPERQTSYEFGLELGMFNGRLGLDFTYFNSLNEDNILAIPIPESTGFATRVINAGSVENKGFEVALTTVPLKIGDFSWSSNINFSLVEQEVIELTEGVDRFLIQSAFNSVQIVAVPGLPWQLSGIDYARDEATGRPLIDPNTGRRIPGEVTNFGSILPDWTGGWINTFNYKGFSFTSTIDVRWGGVMKSATVEDLQTGGLVKETLANREGTFIDAEGLIQVDDGNGGTTTIENNVPLLNAQDYWTSLAEGSVATPWIFDASYVKLREVAISYSLPSKLLENTWLKGVTFGLEGRNLALLYSKVPHIDPEANLFGSGSNVPGGIERGGVPTTRSVGMNVRLTF